MTEPDAPRPLKVFLSYAHADADAVRALYNRLVADGVDAWLDKEKLLPGQDWELEIRKAVREADVVVVCLSKQFNQRGYRQKELSIARDGADYMPEGEIFLIPARLEECEVPESLQKWHWVDLFESDGYNRLLRSLRVRAKRVEADLSVLSDGETNRYGVFEKDERQERSEKISRNNSIKVDKNVSDSVLITGDNNVVNVYSLSKVYSNQRKIERVIRDIKNLIKSGKYKEAYVQCVSFSRAEEYPEISLLAAISYSLENRKKLRKDGWKILEGHIINAMADKHLYFTALAILGCVKYAPFELNGLYDSSELTLSFIKDELQKTNSLKLNRELLGLIEPSPDELDYLDIQM